MSTSGCVDAVSVTTPGSIADTTPSIDCNRRNRSRSSLSAFSQLEEEDRREELNRKEYAALCLRGADCTDMPLSPPSLPKMNKSSTDMPALGNNSIDIPPPLQTDGTAFRLGLQASMTDDSHTIKVNKPMDTAFRLGLATQDPQASLR